MKIEKVNELIEYEFDRLKDIVLNKNIDYGNSLQNPIGTFSQTPMEGLYGRIDDKLGRIRSVGVTEDTIDTVDDLIGYLVHLRIMYNNK